MIEFDELWEGELKDIAQEKTLELQSDVHSICLSAYNNGYEKGGYDARMKIIKSFGIAQLEGDLQEEIDKVLSRRIEDD